MCVLCCCEPQFIRDFLNRSVYHPTCTAPAACIALQVIRTNTSLTKPAGILWHKLSPQKLAQIRVLQQLKERIERETGAKLPSGGAGFQGEL